jgi:hypothetical protein
MGCFYAPFGSAQGAGVLLLRGALRFELFLKVASRASATGDCGTRSPG